MTFKRITFSHKIIVLIAILALLAVPLMALAAELVTAELAGTVNDVTVTQGSSTSFTIDVYATGAIDCAIGSTKPAATATVDTAYSINSAGSVSAGTPSSALSFFSNGVPQGGSGNCGVTWTGDPTHYSVSAGVSAAATTPVADYSVTVVTSETNPSGTSAKLGDTTATVITVHVVAPTSTNSAPTVKSAAADAMGNEGDTLSTSGAFQDPDGDSLSLSVPSGTPGSFFDNGDGTWSWSFLTNDNVSGSVTVTANDGHGHAVTDTFNYSAANVAPTATFNSPDANEGSAINLSLTSPSDPSSADVAAGFTYAFDCGDGAGYGAFGASNTASCPTTDNGTRTVKGEIKDKDGGVNEYTDGVTINNVAPTATFGSPDVDEGSDIILSLTAPADVAADLPTLQYAFDCGSGYGLFSSTNTASCPTTDNGTRTVKGKIKDKDGGVTEYTDSVTINNVAPTATFGNNGPVDEGGPAMVSFSNQFDPSSVDIAAGFHYAYDCSGGDLSGAMYAGSGTSASTTCTFSDNGNYTVSGAIIDKDGGLTQYTTQVTVNNVPPTVTASGNQSSDEGENHAFSLGSFSDPGVNDNPWSVDVDWGDGSLYTSFSVNSQGALGTQNHTYADGPNDYIVTVTVTDKDGGSDSKTFQVHVNNVAPTATFNAPTDMNEGDAINLSLTSPVDPSSVDTTAGFHYAFDCGNGAGYGAYGLSNTASCATTDNGSRTVKGKIQDKDGGETEYTAGVIIHNVAPSVSALAFGNASGTACLAGNNVTLNFSFSDPGVNDNPWAVDINWGDGNHTTYNASSQGAQAQQSHSYGVGSFAISVSVTDKDGGTGSNSSVAGAVSHLYSMSGILAPFNPDGSSVWKYGSTLPVKVKITDCNNTPVSGLVPKVGTSLFSSTDPNLAIDETASTSAADTTGIMRYDPTAGQYIYNFGSKYLSDPSATYYMTVKGTDSNGNIVTTPGIVQVKFGLKAK